jgi:hypothetical protein
MYLEFYLQRESYDGANDGQAEWWINGVSQGTVTGIDNYNSFPTMNKFLLGESGSRPASASGTAYWDDLVIRDDDTEIGANYTTSDEIFYDGFESGDTSSWDFYYGSPTVSGVSTLNVAVTAGAAYYIEVAGYDEQAYGNAVLNLDGPDPIE